MEITKADLEAMPTFNNLMRGITALRLEVHKDVADSMQQIALAAFAEARDLKAWKEQALEVERQWDVQAIGKLLGLKLGEHVRPAIQPALERLVAALTPFAEAFRKRDDPGVSDLDDEQPMSIHVSLGAWRAANMLAPR